VVLVDAGLLSGALSPPVFRRCPPHRREAC
jgi:hypothetical protein